MKCLIYLRYVRCPVVAPLRYYRCTCCRLVESSRYIYRYIDIDIDIGVYIYVCVCI